jgi:hypothetical protein
VTGSRHKPCRNDRSRPPHKGELPGLVEGYAAVTEMSREVLGHGVSRLQ